MLRPRSPVVMDSIMAWAAMTRSNGPRWCQVRSPAVSAWWEVDRQLPDAAAARGDRGSRGRQPPRRACPSRCLVGDLPRSCRGDDQVGACVTDVRQRGPRDAVGRRSRIQSSAWVSSRSGVTPRTPARRRAVGSTERRPAPCPRRSPPRAAASTSCCQDQTRNDASTPCVTTSSSPSAAARIWGGRRPTDVHTMVHRRDLRSRTPSLARAALSRAGSAQPRSH